MDFENPKPEDLEFDFLLENAGCLITVRKYKDFNDEKAQKLFPRSSADYVPSDSYTLPANYFCDAFWKNEKERLENVLDVWKTNKKRLAAAVCGEAAEDHRFLNCMTSIATLISMYEWMLSMCWEGDRSRPPMPLHLYKARLNEMKEANLLAVKKLHELSSDKEFNRKREKAMEKDDDIEVLPIKPKVEEQSEQSSSWKISVMERINEILVVLDTAASAGENVADALTMVMEIRQLSKAGGKESQEQVSAKMKELEQMVIALKKATAERIRNMLKEDSLPPSAPESKPQPAKPTSVAAQASQPTSGRKRGRPRSIRCRDDDEYVEKRRSMPVGIVTDDAVKDPNDDLVSRVKRGQRNRRPARTFTPGWELLSPSPPPPKSRGTPSSVKATPTAEQKPTPLTSKMQAVESPDSGRPSSNESSDNAAAGLEKPTMKAVPDNAAPEKPAAVSQNVPATPIMSVPATLAYTTTTPLSSIAHTNNLSTPTSSVPSRRRLLDPPHIPQMNEQSLMALLKERVQLGDVRLTLLNLLNNENTPQYHFIPLMVEIAEKAIAALEKKDLIVYAMHKAALEVGCSQLGTIMRAANPADPTNQIATLANAMGISPTPFTSMLQVVLIWNENKKNATGIATLNSNLLTDVQATRGAVGACDQLASPYSLAPAASYDSLQYQGFTERDISSYLL
ncbi:hypothetical protein Y032_0224g2725 [Ancylostoma ceylanicum]|uniref:Uncharacterized protein n=1 Tax=Ancylostoma ceylanicum TaxID=53326 RepID=A0A016SIC9_9BILA|nr:hypothetical protein Y032_0224g2725 [Ancylostoma ceylanicum]